MHFTIAAVLAGLLVPLGTPPPLPSSDIGPEATCAVADLLNTGDHPQAALERISKETLALMLEGRADSGVICSAELQEAERRVRAAQSAALTAESYMDDDANGTVQGLKDDAAKAKRHLTTALEEDADNELATALSARLGEEEQSRPQAAVASWTSAKETYLNPAVELLVPLLSCLLALFILARLATRVEWLVPHGMVGKGRKGLAAFAAGCASAAAAVFVLGTGAWAGWWILAAVLAALSVTVGANWLAGRLRILVECRNPSGATDKTAAGHLTALISELGGDDPRGVELPRGSDVMALSGVPLEATPEGRVAKLLAQLASTLLGAAPWQVLVEKVDDDMLAVTVTRNGVGKRSVLVQRQVLGLANVSENAVAEKDNKKDDKKNVVVDLYRVAAAVVVAELARCHDGFEELGLEPDWRSLGLQFVATTDLLGVKDRQQLALAKAVEYDSQNQAARLAYLYCLEREGTKPEALEAYAESLTQFLREIEDQVTGRRPHYEQLVRRALHTRLACEINRYYATRDDEERKAWKAAGLVKAARELWLYHLDGAPSGGPGRGGTRGVQPLTRASQPSAAALLLWAYDNLPPFLLDRTTDQCTADLENLRQWLGRGSAPLANYQTGCYYATAGLARNALKRAVAAKDPATKQRMKDLRQAKKEQAQEQTNYNQADGRHRSRPYQHSCDLCKGACAELHDARKALRVATNKALLAWEACSASLSENDLENAATEPLEHVTLAITHLRRATTDPHLAEWMRKDPQLALVLNAQRYREWFRADPEKDLFAIQPFAALKPQLARLGVTTASDFNLWTGQQLANNLSLTPRAADRIVRLGRAAGFSLRDSDDDYRVELCKEALAVGAVPPVKGSDADLRETADRIRGKVDGRCKGAPSRDEVVRWLRDAGI